MIRSCVVVLVSALVFTQMSVASSFASEITSKKSNDPEFIQVLTTNVNGDVELGFRRCRSEPAAEAECDTVIGKKSYYTVKELIAARHRQEWGVVETSLLDPILIAGTIAGGAVSGGLIGAAVVANPAVDYAGLQGLAEGLVIGGAVGAVGGGVLVKLVHALDPFYHANEAKTIGKALLSGEDIQVMSVEDYAKELAAILRLMR